jgi:hypothetical protein
MVKINSFKQDVQMGALDLTKCKVEIISSVWIRLKQMDDGD